MKFELTPEETRAYQDWVSRLAAQNQEGGLDDVTISFVLTPMGTGVVAHLGKSWEDGVPHIILREVL